MLERIETERGVIDIERPVIAKIIKETILQYKEVVAITNSKGQVSKILNKFDFDKDASYIEIIKDKDIGIKVQIHVIMRFGAKLNEISQTIISEVRKNVKNDADIDFLEVIIHVVGIKSKKVTQRNLTFKG